MFTRRIFLAVAFIVIAWIIKLAISFYINIMLTRTYGPSLYLQAIQSPLWQTLFNFLNFLFIVVVFVAGFWVGKGTRKE